jgi:hypothetical protein
MSTTETTALTAQDYQPGQAVFFAANRVWYPGVVTKATKTTVTVKYTKGSGSSYEQTVNPTHPFSAGGTLGHLASRVRPADDFAPKGDPAAIRRAIADAELDGPSTPSIAAELVKTIDKMAGKQVAGLELMREAAEQAHADEEHIAAHFPTAIELGAEEALTESAIGAEYTGTVELRTGSTMPFAIVDWQIPAAIVGFARSEAGAATAAKKQSHRYFAAIIDGKVTVEVPATAPLRTHRITFANKTTNPIVAKASPAAAATGAELDAIVAEKATPAKKAAAKATPAKVVAPAKKVVSRTDPAHVTATNVAGFPIGAAEPNQDRIGLPAAGHDGYFIRYARGAYDLAARIGDVDGPAWLALCRHGNATGSDQLMGPNSSAEKQAARRKEWCEECAAGNPATDYTAGTAPATPAKKATPAKAAAKKANGGGFDLKAYNGLSAEQKARYQEAKTAGASAADALDAVLAPEPSPRKKAQAVKKADHAAQVKAEEAITAKATPRRTRKPTLVMTEKGTTLVPAKKATK